MDILTIDFETYYDREYSLSKITTYEYIQHDLFEVIGVSVKRNGEPAQWFSGTLADTRQWLSQFSWATSAMLAQNTRFDGAIMAWRFGLRPALYLDTMSMAQALVRPHTGSASLKSIAAFYGIGAKGTEVENALGKRRWQFSAEELALYGAYCVNDVELTYEAFRHMAKSYPKTELKLIDLLLRMYIEPTLQLDAAVLKGELKKIEEQKAYTLMVSGTTPEVLRSDDQFAALLQMHGITPTKKRSIRTGKPAWPFAKTDDFMRELATSPDPKLAALGRARLLFKSSIAESRTGRLLTLGQMGLGLPVPIKYYGAHTGRTSGDDSLNLQNLPRGSALRRAIIAPPGKKLVVADLSQIEARLTAGFAGQSSLLADFAAGNDVYCSFGTELYGRPITKDDKNERWLAKTAVLGLGYGMGAVKFRNTVRQQGVVITEDFAEHTVNTYRRKYHRIPEFWRRLQNKLPAMVLGTSEAYDAQGVTFTEKGAVILPNGMRLFYPQLSEGMNGDWFCTLATQHKKVYGGVLAENLVQAVARIVITDIMLRMHYELGFRVAHFVHDEIVCCVDEDKAETCLAEMLSHMRTPPAWAPWLPLNAEGGIGDVYGDIK